MLTRKDIKNDPRDLLSGERWKNRVISGETVDTENCDPEDLTIGGTHG